MSSSLETVQISTQNGLVIINKSDFDPVTHTLFDGGNDAEKKPKQANEEAPKTKTQRQTKRVTK